MPNQTSSSTEFEGQGLPVALKEVSDLSALSDKGVKCMSVTPRSILMEYGPIRVRHRRTSSQTMSTGRKTKDDTATDEDPVKREIRREKNRMAARELKKTRDNIEIQLMRQVEELEKEQTRLEGEHKTLEDQKSKLLRAIYNAKQTPLIPLVADIDIPLMFSPSQRPDLSVDLRALLKDLDVSDFDDD